jgi:hypothetical protein
MTGTFLKTLLDNDLSTRWSAEGDGQWISYDLGVSKFISGIGIAFYQGDIRTEKFDIFSSIEGINWNKVYEGISSGKSTSKEYFSIGKNARHIKIIGHGNSLNAWNSITEVEFNPSIPKENETNNEVPTNPVENNSELDNFA